jgi:hypothetical protein
LYTNLAEESDFDSRERRFRCIRHIINPVTHSIIFGLDPDVFEASLLVATDDVHNWRRKGVCGKFHNQNTYIRASPYDSRDLKTNNLIIQYLISIQELRSQTSMSLLLITTPDGMPSILEDRLTTDD